MKVVVAQSLSLSFSLHIVTSLLYLLLYVTLSSLHYFDNMPFRMLVVQIFDIVFSTIEMYSKDNGYVIV